MKIDKNSKNYSNEYDKYSDVTESNKVAVIVIDPLTILPKNIEDDMPFAPHPSTEENKFKQLEIKNINTKEEYAMAKKPKIEQEKPKTNKEIKEERLKELKKELKIKG